jgi:uncharacterized protein YgiM (DUF1202 family)
MKTMLRIFALTLALLFTVTLATAEPETLYVAVSELNLRTAASTSADKAAELVKGEPLELEGETSGEWIKVRTTDSYTGWVMQCYLSPEKDYQEWSGEITADGPVNLRTAPGGKRTVKVEPGTEVKVLYPQEADGEQWYRVRVEEKKYSVKAEFVGVGP